MNRSRLPMLIVLLLAAAACLPTTALAVDVAPQAVEDPPGAFVEEEPAAPVTPAPVAPAPAEPTGAVPTGDAPEDAQPIASVAAGRTAEIDVSVATPAALPRTVAPAISSGGSLPFTGVESDRNFVMLAIGSLLVVGGGLLFAVPRTPRRHGSAA